MVAYSQYIYFLGVFVDRVSIFAVLKNAFQLRKVQDRDRHAAISKTTVPAICRDGCFGDGY
jgi:hypothetical protein